MSDTHERRQYLERKPDHKLSKTLKIVAWVVTALVLILVGMMRNPELRIPLPDGVSLGFLPAIHAVINATVAVLLLLAVLAVKQGRITLHKNLMLAAMGFSVLFLLGYVAYHFTNIETYYGDLNGDSKVDPEEWAKVGSMRTVYIVLLITHIVAAAVSLPMILLTFIAAWTNRFEAHRRLANWVFPIWLYVAVTGPICYLMLRPYYN